MEIGRKAHALKVSQTSSDARTELVVIPSRKEMHLNKNKLNFDPYILTILYFKIT